jgi:hypothetical protein
MLRSSQYAAAALQNNTRPGETDCPEDVTEAVRVTRVPRATGLDGEIVNSVEVGEGVTATACAAFENPTASARPRKTKEKHDCLFKGGPLE